MCEAYEDTGIITKGVGGSYVVSLNGSADFRKKVNCMIRGGLRRRDSAPQIGDTVRLEASGDPDYPLVITDIMPRRNSLMRPPVANVDVLFLTFAAAQPEPDLILLDKLLIICAMLEIKPVIIFTKEDLGADKIGELTKAYSDAGFDVLVSSATAPVTREKISEFTGTGISAFAGPSGVGKSTLCNSILGVDVMDVGEVSDKLRRGRHTTRHVELFEIGDGFITDTPGFTSLELQRLGLTYKDIPIGYPEIQKYEGGCRYDDCRHVKSPDCSVIKALEEGKIDKGRYTRYSEFSELLYNERNNYGRRKYGN